MKSFKYYVLGLCLLGTKMPLSANCCGCNGFIAGGDWLYWKVKEENLRAGSFVNDFPNPTLKKATGEVIEPSSRFNNGFRVFAGYEYCKQWDLKASYSYIPLNTNSVFREVIPPDQQPPEHQQFIVPNTTSFPSFGAFSNNMGLIAFNSMLTKLSGDFNDVSVNIGYRFSCNNCFSLKPYIGFRALWIHQNLFIGGELRFPSTNNSTFGRLNYNQKLNGYGIEGGFSAEWQLGYGFAIEGNMGGSILYTPFSTDIFSQSSIGEDGPVVFIIESEGKDTIAIPVIEYFAGIRYGTYVGPCLIKAHVGWEQKIFFNMNQMAFPSGNLSFQGLTLGGAIYF